MGFSELLFFACAVSFDAFSAGILYRLRQIRIPFWSHVVFLVASMVTVSFSVVFGQLFECYLLGFWAKKFGGIFLCGLGVWWCLRDRKERVRSFQDDEQLQRTAIISQILEDPTWADLDTSGTISVRESLFLGIALSVDALVAGFGAALVDFDPLLTILAVGIFQQFFLLLGLGLGGITPFFVFRKKSTFLTSFVLCLLGLYKIIQ
ncbi:MAG: Putative sporulation protein YtaF [Thermoanaerobacterales bacterium 50_218]|nr:MAG: Putative sporulation protein YtaF [Thermoanaerobacterales bacterium 50_218]HAA89683.1 sporulation membrane protein YtaF [Peptococcaceae bacterium]